MLTIESLSVTYGARVALQGINMQVSPGEILGLIGPNGAGKTTLIRAVSGIVRIQSGQVRWDGQALTRLSNTARARLLAVVPQARQLGGAFSVAHTILMGRTAYMGWTGRPSPADHAAVDLAMAQTAVEHLADRRNAQLSGGEQQRVLLARALAQQTPVLLLDEPTNHLDLQHQANFLNLLRRLAQEQNLAVLIALHDLNLVSHYADRVALLVAGRLQTMGSPREVLTTAHLQAAYQTDLQIIEHPVSKNPLILPGLQDLDYSPPTADVS
jgi:iron complex transport system ATP-binding protein